MLINRKYHMRGCDHVSLTQTQTKMAKAVVKSVLVNFVLKLPI